MNTYKKAFFVISVIVGFASASVARAGQIRTAADLGINLGTRAIVQPVSMCVTGHVDRPSLRGIIDDPYCCTLSVPAERAVCLQSNTMRVQAMVQLLAYQFSPVLFPNDPSIDLGSYGAIDDVTDTQSLERGLGEVLVDYERLLEKCLWKIQPDFRRWA